MPTESLSARLHLGGTSVHVVTLLATEAISKATRAEAEVASGDELSPETMVGGAARIELVVDGTVLRTISLIVGEMAFLRITDGSLRYRVTMHAPFWLLTHTRNVRKYRNLSAQDIVTAVLSEGGVAHSWQLTRTPPKRKYCVQYRESNFDFVSRLLEFEGIYFTVENDGSLLLQDDSTAGPMVDAETEFSLLEHAGVLEGREMGIHQFGWGACVRTGKATVGDYSWKTPRVTLRNTALAEHDTELETYEYPAGFRKPSDGSHLAQVRLEAHRADARYAKGAGNVLYFAPGRRLSFDGTPLTLVTVTHEVRDPAFFEGEDMLAYQNRFEAIPSEVKFRAQPRTPKPVIAGCHTVMVRGPVGEEIHTDAYGRFRAQFHWDREATGTDEDSRWLRKLQEPTTSVNLARVGWEVSVAYIDGDPDRPVGLARDINGKMVPTYGQPADKETMTIKTPTYPGGGGYNEIKLDDRGGAQQFNWRAQKDMQIQVNNDKTHHVGNNETRIVEHKAQHEVGKNQSRTIGANQTQTIVSDHQLEVGKDRTVNIGGNQSIDSDANLSSNIKGNSDETVGSLRFSFVGEITPPKVDVASLAPDPEGAAKGAGKAALDAMKGGGGVGDAASAAGGSLKSMLPTADGAAAKLTGGLSQGNWASLLNGTIARTGATTMSRTVGAVHMAVSAASVMSSSRRVYAETIGGAKITLSGEGIAQMGGKVMVATTGGAVFRKSKGNMGYGAERHFVNVGGLTKLETKENLEINGTSITLTAKNKFTLGSGDLKIELTPDEVSVSGPLRIDSGSKVVVTGDKDDIAAE